MCIYIYIYSLVRLPFARISLLVAGVLLGAAGNTDGRTLPQRAVDLPGHMIAISGTENITIVKNNPTKHTQV
jgi:hypothetical protein